MNRSTVYTVAKRYREAGESGLIDRREDNGTDKLTPEVLAQLCELVAGIRSLWYKSVSTCEVHSRTGISNLNWPSLVATIFFFVFGLSVPRDVASLIASTQ